MFQAVLIKNTISGNTINSAGSTGIKLIKEAKADVRKTLLRSLKIMDLYSLAEAVRLLTMSLKKTVLAVLWLTTALLWSFSTTPAIKIKATE